MMMNKKRTLVTMIGIIISVAMITAVSTVGYSIMDFMARMAMVDNGFFHVKFGNYFYKDNGRIVDEFDVENYSLMKTVGDYVYEFDDESNLVITPYVYSEDKYENGYSDIWKTEAFRMLAVQDNYYETASIRLSEGDYPKNNREILLSKEMAYRYEDKRTGDTLLIGGTQYTISGIINEELLGIEDGNRLFDVDNYTEEVEYMEKSMLLMSVFVYGFIILMSLICAANIVNTISTSLALRKREFAMLKSVGMTDKAFRKMIAYESGFYGIKALIFGLPVGTAIMLRIRNVIEKPMGVELGIPWMGYIIAIAGVFIVIGTTMLYSAKKIRKENVIDALKNENV